MFKIGDFSRLSRVSIRMLRYYDENDLFKPEVVDDFTGYRYYSATQIRQLNMIITLRDYGFNVLDIGAFLSASKDKQEQMLKAKQKEIAQTIDNEKQKFDKVSSAIKNLNKENIDMEYKVDIKSIPSMKAITLRSIIPTYGHEGILWEKLGKYVGKKQIKTTGYCYATYYDEECKESNVDVEVLMEVKTMGKDDGDIKYVETKAIEKAVYILVPGDFSNIAPAFEYLGLWMEKNNHEIAGNLRQVPIKGPWSENDPKDYLTEIQCPIK